MSIEKANKIVEAINEIEPDREFSFSKASMFIMETSS